MTEPQEKFDRLGPWTTRFWVDGVPCGGSAYDPTDDARMAMFERESGPLAGKRVLELGPLEGGHTIQLARKGASVVGIEGHEANYRRCLFVQEFFHLENVEFILADLRAVDFEALGPFDMIFSVGVLYHMDKPWKLLTALRSVARRMFISTHCAAPGKADAVVDADGCRLEGMWHQEGPPDEPLSGLQPQSFWPTREYLTKMLVHTGWRTITWMDYSPDHTNGPLASLWVDQTPSGWKRLLPFRRQAALR